MLKGAGKYWPLLTFMENLQKSVGKLFHAVIVCDIILLSIIMRKYCLEGEA